MVAGRRASAEPGAKGGAATTPAPIVWYNGLDSRHVSDDRGGSACPRTCRSVNLTSVEAPMIVVRNVFRLKFGQARPAVAHWKKGLEHTLASMAEFEQTAPAIMANTYWHAWYQKFVPLCESGSREILTLVE